MRRNNSSPETVKQLWGGIDVLINGAGPYHRVNLFDETIAGWREMFDGNLHPVFYLAQMVAPGMKKRTYGRIVNFSMANADRMVSQPDVTAHYIAKAGVLILTRTLAKLLAPYGITVNAISPGFIDSGSAPPGELAGVDKRFRPGISEPSGTRSGRSAIFFRMRLDMSMDPISRSAEPGEYNAEVLSEG